MGDVTEIGWTDSTFNPWVGCQRVSPGCVNCYAEAQDHRWGHNRWGPTALRERTSVANWRKPVAWSAAAEKLKKRRRVFCASLADVFEDRQDLVDVRLELFDLIRRTPWLDWQLLTKRPENVLDVLGLSMVAKTAVEIPTATAGWLYNWISGRPPSNVWVGTTVEDQARARTRVDALSGIPAKVRFLSVEPLLEAVTLDLRCVGWVIAGGESGPKARPMEAAWVRSVRDQCLAEQVPFFFKQWGRLQNNPDPNDTFTHGKGGSGLDGRTWKEFPP